ncbi:hypothetical protein ACQPXS_47640 (plasmid) [Streptomyces sp. CA-142005]|uniref:hypothetical protein n=1 Tax=Streptomyces sp. CA-142005 TaxID=3240052 RepID=UPI003D8CF7A8
MKIHAAPDDFESPAPAVATSVETRLPRYLRSLLPHMALKGWVMPLVFAVITSLFWAYSSSQADLTPKKHAFEAYCFAAVTVFFVLARLWVGWRVRQFQAAKQGRSLGLDTLAVNQRARQAPGPPGRTRRRPGEPHTGGH